jgi:hypothetical protein
VVCTRAIVTTWSHHPLGIRALLDVCSSSRRIGFGMMLSDIQLIAKAAEKACAAAINHPHSKDVREHLFDTLGAVIDPAFVESDAAQLAHLHDLRRRASVGADTVRVRIDNSRHSRVAASAASIRYPARDLQQLLSQLIGELAEGRDA